MYINGYLDGWFSCTFLSNRLHMEGLTIKNCLKESKHVLTTIYKYMYNN